MTEVAEQKKKRTFRKFVYRGVDLEQLLEMNEFVFFIFNNLRLIKATIQ